MRRIAGILAVLLIAIGWAPHALAAAGSTTDPDDNAGELDIKTASHSDTANDVTLTVESYESWTAAAIPYYALVWLFDFDADGQPDDGCLAVAEGAAEYEYKVSRGDCNDGDPVPTQVATGNATRPSGTTLSVTVTLTNLRAAGLPTGATSYRYRLHGFDNNSAVPTDTVPNSGFVTHDLSAPPASTTTTTVSATQSAATASPNTLGAGQSTTVTGGGFAANADLTATLFSDPVILASFKADSAGRFSQRLTIPASTLPGSHRLVISGTGASGVRHESVVTLTIVLPRTGASTSTGHTGATGVAIAALGFALLMLAYYERQRVSVGATRASAALSDALKRFEL